jgi:N-carbamoylputrescine amidase
VSGTITVGLVQHACSEDRAANLDKSIELTRQAAAKGASLIVLQELHGSRYFPQCEDTAYFEWAEPVPGHTTARLGMLAGELGVVIVASLFERRTAGIYHNTAVVFDKDGSVAGKYRKMHVPEDPGYYEKFYFSPGDLGFHPIATSLGKVGVLVCWDQWFPEAARLMALRGADLLVYPTAIGWDPSDPQDEKDRQFDAWLTLQRSHAIANGLPVLSVNRVGHEPDPLGVTSGIQFWGASFAAGPQGEMLAKASATDDEVLVIDLDLRRSEEVRQIWPFLRDRRVDAYTGLDSRFLD